MKICVRKKKKEEKHVKYFKLFLLPCLFWSIVILFIQSFMSVNSVFKKTYKYVWLSALRTDTGVGQNN